MAAKSITQDTEPIPYYFDMINRSAIVLFPKQPFFDWLVSVEKENEKVKNDQEGDIYLIPDYEELSEMRQWLKKHFDEIFIDQLNNWYTDESLWPKKRTLLMFHEWFSVTFHSMVLDTQEKQITK